MGHLKSFSLRCIGEPEIERRKGEEERRRLNCGNLGILESWNLGILESWNLKK
jgi:hypothetical protein